MADGFLSNFDYEIFISYARGNNGPHGSDALGWVSQFKMRLEAILSSRLPGLRIFFDDGSLLGDENPESCEEYAAQSATLIVVLSPLYLSRQFCLDELASFVNENGINRIFCVLLDDVELQERPDELKTIGYDFQHRDPIDRTIRRPMDLNSAEAEDQLYRLAGHVEQRLNELAETTIEVNATATYGPAKVDADRLPSGSGQFIGRASEFRQIDEAIERPETPVVEIVARGGEGKTSLLTNWIAHRSVDGWGTIRSVFAWSFYSQGLNEQEASTDLMFEEAFRFFGHEGDIPLSPHEKGKLLAKSVAKASGLLVLDGVEPLQLPPGPNEGALKDPGLRTLLRTTALASDPGLVLMTTRIPISDLDELRPRRVAPIELPPLDTESARQVLANGGVKADDMRLDAIADSLQRHALSLQLAASYIREALEGDVSRWKEDGLSDQDEADGGHAFRVLHAYESWLSGTNATAASLRMLEMVRLLGLFDRPISKSVFFHLFGSEHSCDLTSNLAVADETTLQRTLSKLVDLGLVLHQADGTQAVDCHPLIRQYFAGTLADFGRSANRKMHAAVYGLLQSMAPDQPENAKENSVLFQAVRHGVLAGKYEAALSLYETRINHNTATFVWLRLGQYSDVINCMGNFTKKFPDVPLPALGKKDQRLVMNQTGCALMAAGRPRDALKALVKNVHLIHQSDRDGGTAATNLNNAAECLFFLGMPTSLMQFSAHAASAFEWTIKHGQFTNTPRDEIHWATGLNARLLYGIGLGHAGLLMESLQALDATEAWFRTCYANADELYATQLRYWRSHLLSNCLHGSTSINRVFVQRVGRCLSAKYASVAPRKYDYFGPFDQGAFYLSRAELRLSLLVAIAEGRVEKDALKASDTDNVREEMINQVEADLNQADQRMSMNANRLWMGLIQTRQLQLARTKETLGMPASEAFDFDATLADVMLLSQRERLRLLATDALLEQAHRARLFGDEPMVIHCLSQIDAFDTTEVAYPFKTKWPEVAPDPFAAVVPTDLRFRYRQRERDLLAVDDSTFRQKP
ncbi:MAG: toll/interleukin-1 receptor domain-containing protein [Rubripirellula sp.]